MTRLSLDKRVEAQIRRSKKLVFCRADFQKLSAYDQIGRALLTLVREGKLIRVGSGLYAKARLNSITKKPMLDAPGGFYQIVLESLKRLKVKYKLAGTTQAYLAGSTQIPMKLEVQTRSRFNRKISYQNLTLSTKKVRG